MKNSKEKIKIFLSQSVVSNILSVGLLTLVVKGLGFYKETLVASTFGLSKLLDTFYIAVLIPNFVQNVFVSALKNLFIPNYLLELKTSKKIGEFQSVGFLIITLIVVVLTILCILFSIYFLEYVFSGHDLEYYRLIRKQLYIILPCLIFWGYSSLLSGLLEINDKFVISSVTPIISSITTIICLLVFQEQLKEMVLAYGLLTGTIISFFYLLFYSIGQKELLIKRPRINDNIRSMIRELPPKITSGFLTGVNPFVDQFFAAQLAIGSIAAINYGIKIPAFVIGIILIALGNVLLPHFSKLIVEDMSKAYKQLFQILKLIFVTAAVISLVTAIFSNQIIELLFERNEFDSEDTALVADLQQIVLIYVPFFLCTNVLVKFLTSINKNSFMAWTSLWNLILNIILNYALMDIYGIYGLVMSTTIVYIISSFFYFGFTWKEYKKYQLHLSNN